MRAEIRSTAALALPMILGQTAQVLMHVIDTAMAGRLGVDALAAAAMGNNAAALFFLVGVALGSTVPALAARAFGAGDRARMNLILRHGLAISLVYAVGCVLVFGALSHHILPLFGPPELAIRAAPYTLLLLASMMPAMLVQNLRGFAEAQNRPWLPVGNIALGIGLNVIFNFGFIYGRWGFPALGLPGAALGTLLARGCMLAHFAWLLHRQPGIAPAPDSWRPMGWRGGFYREYLRVALPTAVITVVFFGNTVVTTAWIGRFGPVAIAANEITRQVALLLFTLPLAFSLAIAIRVGQAAGAGDHAAVRRVAAGSVLVSFGAMVAAATLVGFGRHTLPTWFLDPSASQNHDAVLTLTAHLLLIATWVVATNGFTLACLGVFRGLANLRAAAFIYVTGLWVIGLPLAYVLGSSRAGGPPGIWQGLVTGNALTALGLAGLLWWMLPRASAGRRWGPA